MTSGPSQSEQVYDPEFEQLVANLCRRPGMYVDPPTFGSVCAFLDGFDMARSGGPLMGLKQWLVVRANAGNNLVWWTLAQQQLVPDTPDAERPDEERAVQALGRLLAEFFDDRRNNGLTHVFHDYAQWLLRRSWYTGPLRRPSARDAEPDAGIGRPGGAAPVTRKGGRRGGAR